MVPFSGMIGIAWQHETTGYPMWYGQVEGTDIAVLDPRFKVCFAGHVRVERLWTGAHWAEGSAWFAAGRPTRRRRMADSVFKKREIRLGVPAAGVFFAGRLTAGNPCWNECFFAALLTSTDAKSLPVMVASQTGSQGINWWSMAALSTAAIAALVVVGIFLERYIVSGLTTDVYHYLRRSEAS